MLAGARCEHEGLLDAAQKIGELSFKPLLSIFNEKVLFPYGRYFLWGKGTKDIHS